MDYDTSLMGFKLTEQDIADLGQPEFGTFEPLASAPKIHARAESRSAMNDQRALELAPQNFERMRRLEEISRTATRLGVIRSIVSPFIPKHDVTASVEMYLRRQNFDDPKAQ